MHIGKCLNFSKLGTLESEFLANGTHRRMFLLHYVHCFIAWMLSRRLRKYNDWASCSNFDKLIVLSLVPGKIGYGPGKLQGPGTGRGLVSLLITRIAEKFKALHQVISEFLVCMLLYFTQNFSTVDFWLKMLEFWKVWKYLEFCLIST